jgi:DNA-binding response OmpR family regulator
VIARIRAVTRRYTAAQTGRIKAAPMVMGDLTVLPDELRARRRDAVIDLSLRDVRMLELLHRNRGKVVDRNQFFDECWGREYMPSSRTLDQHIAQLRRRIEIDPKSPAIILTVHGVGYRYDGK